jgi:hypothetical protein
VPLQRESVVVSRRRNVSGCRAGMKSLFINIRWTPENVPGPIVVATTVPKTFPKHSLRA